MDKTIYGEFFVLMFVIFLAIGVATGGYDPDRPLPHGSCVLMHLVKYAGFWDEGDRRCANR